MKNILTVTLLFISTFVFSQKTNPVDPRNNPQKDTVIYLTPEAESFDTSMVYAVVADLKQPLTVQKYQLVTKYWIYKGGRKNIADQWLEKVTEGIATKIPNFKKRVLWIIKEEDF